MILVLPKGKNPQLLCGRVRDRSIKGQSLGLQRQVILDKALGAFAQRPEIFLSQLKLIQPVIVRKENVPHRLQYRRTEQDRRTQILRRTAVRLF